MIVIVHEKKHLNQMIKKSFSYLLDVLSALLLSTCTPLAHGAPIVDPLFKIVDDILR